MRGPGGPLVTDLADGRHPNDAGYVKMANIWFQGIQEVIGKGFLTKATTTNKTSSAVPRKGNATTTQGTGEEKPTAVSFKSSGTRGMSPAMTFGGILFLLLGVYAVF